MHLNLCFVVPVQTLFLLGYSVFKHISFPAGIKIYKLLCLAHRVMKTKLQENKFCDMQVGENERNFSSWNIFLQNSSLVTLFIIFQWEAFQFARIKQLPASFWIARRTSTHHNSSTNTKSWRGSWQQRLKRAAQGEATLKIRQSGGQDTYCRILTRSLVVLQSSPPIKSGDFVMWYTPELSPLGPHKTLIRWHGLNTSLKY